MQRKRYMELILSQEERVDWRRTYVWHQFGSSRFRNIAFSNQICIAGE
jgi:hypothetical protein